MDTYRPITVLDRDAYCYDILIAIIILQILGSHFNADHFLIMTPQCVLILFLNSIKAQ